MFTSTVVSVCSNALPSGRQISLNTTSSNNAYRELLNAPASEHAAMLAWSDGRKEGEGGGGREEERSSIVFSSDRC